jgi:acetolactate synthase-1/2/3 large subunit
MKVSDYIALKLESKGVEFVFELSGGMITHILDSINQKTSIDIITMHHEQSAAFAADAVGRVLGMPGIALATSGPGATNLLTGIGSCYFDSVPAVFITGQVNRHEQKGDRGIRQLGFQETDIVSMSKHITKASFKVEYPDDVPKMLELAFQIALSGRPGPVLLDIPMDIQRANIQDDLLSSTEEIEDVNSKLIDDEIVNLSVELAKSKKPILLVGRGLKASFVENEFYTFLSLTELPVVSSLLAIDALEHNHPNRIGFIGSYGNRWSNIALGECDLLIVLGSRLDIRQTGADTKIFESKKIFHIDCEVEEINNRIKGCVPICCNIKTFLNRYIEINTEKKVAKKLDWFDYLNKLRNKWPDINELKVEGINPNVFFHSLSQNSSLSKAYLADVGSHQMWAAQSLEIKSGQLFLTSAGMGAMGFALPASIGACFALNRKPVVAIIGDGCMQINIQELQTIFRNQLPIKIIIMNNRNLGMIRQFQDSYFESRYQSTWWGYSAPDFEKIGLSYGIISKTIENEEEVFDAIQWLWCEENINKPMLLQVLIHPLANAYPKIAFGKPITEMEPFCKPIDMEGT